MVSGSLVKARREIKEKRLTYQRQEKKTSLHCCVPLCANSSRYNSDISFHRFPVDPEVRARWLTQIRRDNFSPLQSTRVCSRHFNTGDFVVTAVGKKKTQQRSGALSFCLERLRHARTKA
ncbi:hypothetical protein NFI96_026105 [Prochilodus magdalenae]|nr:hypothetical protein NFI96_026105 [Prochilodus magdalenae]